MQANPLRAALERGEAADRHVGQPRAQSGDPDIAEGRRPGLRAGGHGAHRGLDGEHREHGAAVAGAEFSHRRAAARGQSRVDHPAARLRRVEPALSAGRERRARRRDRRRLALCAARAARQCGAQSGDRLRHGGDRGGAARLRQPAGVRHRDVRDRSRVQGPRCDRRDGRHRCAHDRAGGSGAGPRRVRHARAGASCWTRSATSCWRRRRSTARRARCCVRATSRRSSGRRPARCCWRIRATARCCTRATARRWRGSRDSDGSSAAPIPRSRPGLCGVSI